MQVFRSGVRLPKHGCHFESVPNKNVHETNSFSWLIITMVTCHSTQLQFGLQIPIHYLGLFATCRSFCAQSKMHSQHFLSHILVMLSVYTIHIFKYVWVCLGLVILCLHTGLPRDITSDGLEVSFATNHVGPFLLTNLLLGKIQHIPLIPHPAVMLELCVQLLQCYTGHGYRLIIQICSYALLDKSVSQRVLPLSPSEIPFGFHVQCLSGFR